jgi:hypothetical protein
MITRWNKLFDSKRGRVEKVDWVELFKEFSEPKPFKGDDKHPGWSAAVFDPPERALVNVQHVSAIVLDYDGGTTIDQAASTWQDHFGFIHTSRHNTATEPRFRVILPLSRPVSRFEYSALWTKINAHTNNATDKKAKDASRFWYTPGVADVPGAAFETRQLTGAYLNPDEWLDKPAAAPAPATVTPISHGNRVKRARAYLEKMPAAISGAGGHQALWQAARKLTQDFQLDRQQALQLLRSEYNPRCQPPWADRELEHKVDDAISKARVANPVSDRPYSSGSSAATKLQPQPVDDWHAKLALTDSGKLRKDAGNVALILKHDEELAGCLEHDSFADLTYWARDLPDDIGIAPPRCGDRLQDHHATYIQHKIAKLYGPTIPKQAIWDGMESSAMDAAINPLQDYLRSLTWDGKQRLPTWLHTYLGAAGDEYTHAVGIWFMISAVARALRPGCKADHMLILEGTQGIGKSRAIHTLGGEWYLGRLPDLRDIDRAAEAIQGNWIVEVGELDAMRGTAEPRIKDFLTQQTDEYRAAYARKKKTMPRCCVFIGSTNEDHYLGDATGGRRFWPVRVSSIDVDALQQDRDQLWAEAVVRFESGEQWHPTPDLATRLAEEQEARFQSDDWEPLVAEWLRKQLDHYGWEQQQIRTVDVLQVALGIDAAKIDKKAQMRVSGVLKRLGLRNGRCTGKRYFLATGKTRELIGQ